MIAVFVSPMQFFRAALSRPPEWARATVPVVLAAMLAIVASMVTAARGHAVMERAVAGSGIDVIPFGVMVGVAVLSVLVGMAVSFWLSVGGVIAIDVMFAGGSGQARRLVEFSALAYWVHVPWGVVGIVVALMFYSPAPLDLPLGGDQLEVEQAMSVYQAADQGTAFMLTTRLIGAYVGLWFVALQACALRVVSGISVAGASAAGVVLGLVFVVLPWAVQRF